MNASTKGNEQRPHFDNYFNTDSVLNDMNKAFMEPPYFAEVTSSQPTPIWVLEHSHKEAGKNWRERKEISRSSPLKLIFIPQWSIYLSRGDSIHAGASGRMAAKLRRTFPGTCRCPRARLYIGRVGVPLPDSINIPHAHFFGIDDITDIGQGIKF